MVFEIHTLGLAHLQYFYISYSMEALDSINVIDSFLKEAIYIRRPRGETLLRPLGRNASES